MSKKKRPRCAYCGLEFGSKGGGVIPHTDKYHRENALCGQCYQNPVAAKATASEPDDPESWWNRSDQPDGSAELISKANGSTVEPTEEELEREEQEFQNSPAGEFFATLNDIYFQLKELRYGREITDEVIETVGGMQRELHLACLAVVGGYTRKELDQLFRKNRRAARRAAKSQ
jgi:hypothetical protein